MSASDPIGVIPAAGLARRLGKLPCSKELYPIGVHASADEASAAGGTPARGGVEGADSSAAAQPDGIEEQNSGWKGAPDGGQGPDPAMEPAPGSPRVACEHVLLAMRRAGVREAYVVLREGKWDIPAYLGDGSPLDLHIAYLMMGRPDGVPFTIDQAAPFVEGRTVVMGFPDILFEPPDLFARILTEYEERGADLVLGLVPTASPERADVVDLDASGQVRRVVVKSASTSLRQAWIAAAWGPEFTSFLHAHLQERPPTSGSTNASELPSASAPELHFGAVIQAALGSGLGVYGVALPDGRYLDIGTPGELARAVRGSW